MGAGVGEQDAVASCTPARLGQQPGHGMQGPSARSRGPSAAHRQADSIVVGHAGRAVPDAQAAHDHRARRCSAGERSRVDLHGRLVRLPRRGHNLHLGPCGGSHGDGPRDDQALVVPAAALRRGSRRGACLLPSGQRHGWPSKQRAQRKRGCTACWHQLSSGVPLQRPPAAVDFHGAAVWRTGQRIANRLKLLAQAHREDCRRRQGGPQRRRERNGCCRLQRRQQGAATAGLVRRRR